MKKNRELADKFREIADMLELKGVEWKPRAYREAAYGVEQGDDIEKIYEEEGKKGLKEMPGVGDSIADHIIEYLEKGKIKKFQKLRKKYSKEMTEMTELEGLGPKTVKRLMKRLDIDSMGELKKAAEKHKISRLKGFGEKTEKNILDALKTKKEKGERMLLSKALPIAEETVEYLKKDKSVEKIDYVGSLRRMKETIGDIDILVISKKPEKIMDRFTGMDDVKKVLAHGKTKSSVIIKEDDVQIDLRVVEKSSYAAAMQYFTGSKQHGIAARKVAKDKGYKLSEYGLFKRKAGKKKTGEDKTGENNAEEKKTGNKTGKKTVKRTGENIGKKISLTTEKSLYKKLGMDYIPPELRENRGEIEKAKKGKLPRLVELDDIKGDLQMHTKYSDGSNTIKEMAEKAADMGYRYIAITDHSKSQRVAGGMTEKEVKKQMKEITKAAKGRKIKILKGAEVDILKSGKLDFSDKILKELDIVVASIHSNFKMPSKKMTERILKALDNRYVSILSHPTGRQIGKRKGYDADWEKIFQRAADNGVLLEINSQPDRLDLNDNMILMAKDHKVKFAVDTDSHSADSLEYMRYGIGQARRGWLEKKDIVNTYGYKKLMKTLR